MGARGSDRGGGGSGRRRVAAALVRRSWEARRHMAGGVAGAASFLAGSLGWIGVGVGGSGPRGFRVLSRGELRLLQKWLISNGRPIEMQNESMHNGL